MQYYRHHIGDFIKATARLSDSQKMVYLQMLWEYYETEKPLPNDPHFLAFRFGTTPEEIVLIARSFFQIDGEVIRQKRCDSEILEFHGYCEKKSLAGKASAAKRAELKKLKLTIDEQQNNNSSTGVKQVLNSSSTIDEQLPTTHYPLPNDNNSTVATATAELTPAARNKTISVKDLIEKGIPEELAKDWLTLRKSKRAPVTPTVIKSFAKEAALANITVKQAMELCCLRGWQGFQASWVINARNQNQITTFSQVLDDPEFWNF